MAKTILDLFKSRQTELYQNEGSKLFIDTKGLINVPRAAALAASSPTAIGALIGNEIGGTLKGTADRPSDTIFRNNKFFSKPVSLFPGVTEGIEPGESYYIKKTPKIPPSFIAKIKQGATNPKQALMETGVKLLKDPVGSLKKFKDLTGKLAKNSDTATNYGAKFSEDKNGVVLKEDYKFSEYAPVYNLDKDSNGNENWKQTGVEKRKQNFSKTGKSPLDQSIQAILEDRADRTESQLLFGVTDIPYVLISSYPNKSNKIYLPGTISGLSEDFSPEWNDFKYLGSPFKIYRYGGVERSIKFQLKLYYTDGLTKKAMQKNIEKLKKLVFPNEQIAAAIYPGNNGYSPLSFTPNILFLTVNGIYKEIPCIMESLSISISDEVPWASGNQQLKDNTDSVVDFFNVDLKYDDVDMKPYPVVMDIDMGFKIIESLQIKSDDNGINNTYKYNDYFTNPNVNIPKSDTNSNTNVNGYNVNSLLKPVPNTKEILQKKIAPIKFG